MKSLILVLGLLFVTPSFATEAVKEITVSVASPAPAPAVEAVAPMPETAPVATHLPPAWLEKVLDVAVSVPVVGPVVVEVLKWVGVISSILTAIVTAALGLIWSLSRALKLAKLVDLAVKIEALAASPVMYWLRFFSMYNAKKEEKKDAGTAPKAA
jgi:hypothetical protein